MDKNPSFSFFKLGTQVESNFPNLQFPPYSSIFAFSLFPFFLFCFFFFENSPISLPNVGYDHECIRKEPPILAQNGDARGDQCLGCRNDGQSIILTPHDNQSNETVIENPFPYLIFENFPI